MKIKTILVAAVMFLGLSAAAFSQVTFSVGSIPVTAVVGSDVTAKTGDITFSTIATASMVTGSITITYPVGITAPIPAQIILGGVLAPLASVAIVGAGSSNQAGQLVINLAPFVGVPAGSDLVVSGVRIDASNYGLSTMSVQISATGNAIVAGQTTPEVISNILPGLGATNQTAATINAVSGVVTGASTVGVKENFNAVFGVTNTTDTTQTLSTMLRFTVSALPPKGVTVTWPTTVAFAAPSTTVFTLSDSAGAAAAAALAMTSTTTSLDVYYRVTGDSNNLAVETLTIPLGVAFAGAANLPLPATTLTYTVTLAPIGSAKYTASGAITSGLPANPIPRYAEVAVAGGAFLVINPSNTVLLIPFATVVAASGFDSGISIANTTTDPGATPMGLLSAIKQTGTVTFYFYPQQVGATAGTPFTYTTSSSSPGTGLDTTGKIPSGSTYTVLVSQLLTAAGVAGDFTGYIIAIPGFTNAHAQYVLADWKGFSQGALALVIGNIPGARTATPEALDN